MALGTYDRLVELTGCTLYSVRADGAGYVRSIG